MYNFNKHSIFGKESDEALKYNGLESNVFAALSSVTVVRGSYPLLGVFILTRRRPV